MSAWQRLLLLAALVLLAAPAFVPWARGSLPSGEQSRLVGWRAPDEAADIAADIFERVNAEREARGALPLEWDDDLASLAGEWSERMIDHEFEHSPTGFREHDRFVATGENIAAGQRSSWELHRGWMRSDGHRENLLNADWDAVGIGVVCRRDGLMWATQIFGLHEAGSPRPSVDDGPEPIVADARGLRCPGHP